MNLFLRILRLALILVGAFLGLAFIVACLVGTRSDVVFVGVLLLVNKAALDETTDWEVS